MREAAAQTSQEEEAKNDNHVNKNEAIRRSSLKFKFQLPFSSSKDSNTQSLSAVLHKQMMLSPQGGGVACGATGGGKRRLRQVFHFQMCDNVQEENREEEEQSEERRWQSKIQLGNNAADVESKGMI